MSPMRHFFYRLLLLSLTAAGTGCATTPQVSKVVQEVQTPPEPPQIASAKGFLSPEQSSALIEHLKHQTDPTDMLGRQIAVMESVSRSPLVKGNKVTLLVDGPATYAAMFKLVEQAHDHINLESYVFEDVRNPASGESFADLLMQKQAAGVQVHILYDSVGSMGTPAALFKRLRNGGIQVIEFNPVNPLLAHGKWRLTQRDHRKILVVDGKVAISGGVNISEVYSGELTGIKKETEEAIPWRDTDVQIEGPAVAEFQKLFLDTWQREKGAKLTGRHYFPPLKDEGDALIKVVGNTPGVMNRITFIMYVSAITFADKYVHLTNAYFVPDRQMVRALTGAAGRGADVKLILPQHSSSWLALSAGRYHYAELLQAGVKLYERRNAVLHAKTAVIDGVWSTVGSTNMDFLSFSKNDEVNAIILSRRFADAMEQMFVRDLRDCEQILGERWRKRSVYARIKEWFAHLFSDWL
ncbi:MAG TPA: phospholipase D-like domain-containing protein [Geobacteraceae bacterium]